MPCVGVLPKSPISFVLQLVDVVVGNPKRILVKYFIIEIMTSETVRSVKDRCYAVVLLNNVQPSEDFLFQLVFGITVHFIDFGFHIENRGKVTVFQLHHAAEKFCLLLGGTLRAEKMVSSSCNAILPRLGKVQIEVHVEFVGTLSCLDEDKADRGVLNGGIAKSVPVDSLLVMRDVDASHRAFRVIGFSIESLPAEGVGTYKSLVEEKYVDENDNNEKPPQKM